jgi:hypothetical protein
LINAKAYLMPYFDIRPGDPAWASVQRVGATGILRGTGVPEGWANKTMFYPDSTLLRSELRKGLADWYGVTMEALPQGKDRPVEFSDLSEELKKYLPESQRIPSEKNRTGPLKRKDLAVLIDTYLDPFHTEIDLTGKPIRK